MNTDVTMLYETLYRLASKDPESNLFGVCAPLAQGVFQRASVGMPMPIVWFEVPFSGTPRFDLHVAYGNADLHEHAPFAPDSMDGHGELLNWYASEPRGGDGLALAYDVGDGRVDAPAVHANVNDACAFDVAGFFAHVGRPEAAVLYDGFAKRLPQGWRIWYFGVHPGRPGAPIRIDCFVDKNLKRAYAAEPSRFAEDLCKAGFAIESSAALRVGAEVAASPFGMELQFDVLSDGNLGQTVGVSARLPFAPANKAQTLWEAAGDAARLMGFAEEAGIADARWQHVRGATYTMAVRDGDVMRALYCIPVFVKFRVRANALLDAKVYLQAGAVSLSALQQAFTRPQ